MNLNQHLKGLLLITLLTAFSFKSRAWLYTGSVSGTYQCGSTISVSFSSTESASTQYTLQISIYSDMHDATLISNVYNTSPIIGSLVNIPAGVYYARVVGINSGVVTIRGSISGTFTVQCFPPTITTGVITPPVCNATSCIPFTTTGYLNPGTTFQVQTSSDGSTGWAALSGLSTSSCINVTLPTAYPTARYYRVVTTNTNPIVYGNAAAYTTNGRQFSADFAIGIAASSTLDQAVVYATPVSGSKNDDIYQGGASYWWEVGEVTSNGAYVAGTVMTNPSNWWASETSNYFPGYTFIQGRCYKVTRCIWSCVQAWTCVSKTVCIPPPCGTSFDNPCDLGSFCNQTKTITTDNSRVVFANNYTSSSAHGQNSNDVWYKFRVNNTTTGKLKVNTCGSGLADTYIHILDHNKTEISYNDDASNMAAPYAMPCYSPGTYLSGIPSSNDANGMVTLAGGQDYYLVVEGYGQNQGPITAAVSIICCDNYPAFVSDFTINEINFNYTTGEYNVIATPFAGSKNHDIIAVGAAYSWRVYEYDQATGQVIPGTELSNLPNWHDDTATACTFPGYPTNTNQTTVNGVFKNHHHYEAWRGVVSPCQSIPNKQWAWTVDYNGVGKPTLVQREIYSPSGFTDESQSLETGTLGVFPNPTNDKLIVSYNLTEATHVTIALYDLLGKQIKILQSGLEQASSSISHEFSLKDLNLTTGVYIVKANLGTQMLINKFVFNSKQ